jgi:hypothetical protein
VCVQDAERWKDGLEAWKKYLVDFETFYGAGARPVLDDDGDDDDLFAGGGAGEYRSGLTALEELDTLGLEDVDLSQEDVLNPLHGDAAAPGQGKGLFGGLFGGGGKKKSPVDTLMAHVDTSAPMAPKPKGKDGWLQKKGSGGAFGADWHKRFCKVDEDACALTYSKTDSVDGDGKLDGPGTTSIDLKAAVSIEPYDKAKGKGDKGGGDKKKKKAAKADLDFSRFNIDMGEEDGGKVYKFKAATADEGKAWLKALQAWRDYAVLDGV